MRTMIAWGVAALLLLLSGLAARAADSVYYSDVDQYYGWAAGYSSSRADTAAKEACTSAGGTDCQLALHCDTGGWGAVAFGEGTQRGVGLSCGIVDSFTARAMALAECAMAAQDYCWTESTFNGSGVESSKDSNKAFDLTLYTQEILRTHGLYTGAADGESGPQTTAAIEAFQTKLGLAPTGVVDDDLFQLLVAAAGGRQGMVAGLKEAFIDPNIDKMTDRIYSFSSEPRAIETFVAELASDPGDQLRSILAALLSVWDTPCTVPAQSADVVDADGGVFDVTCDQGPFRLVLDADNHTISPGTSIKLPSPPPDTSPPPPPDTTPPPPPGQVTKKLHSKISN